MATPAIRDLIKKNNLDIQSIDGTGEDGRILKQDVEKNLKSKNITQ